MPVLDVAARIADRDFPSVFMAWNKVENRNESPDGPVAPVRESAAANIARHDLAVLHYSAMGLKPARECEGMSAGFTADSVRAALARRAEILKINPSAALVLEVHHRDAPDDYLPVSSPWWKRTARGARIPASGKSVPGAHYLLDEGSAEFRHHVALQCRAAVQSGVFDGCMFDWWNKSDDDPNKVALARQTRAAIGEDALIVVNAGETPPKKSAPFVNGWFMEGFGGWWKDWALAERNLTWAQTRLREPRLAALEVWFETSRSAPEDLRRMRAATALVLTRSDGAVLFGDPNELPTPDHLHDWYPFWDKGLGRPLGPATVAPDGSARREFERGTVVFVPDGAAPASVSFASGTRRSRAEGRQVSTRVVPPGDGDIFER